MTVRPSPRLVLLLVVSAAYFAAVCVYLSNRRMMWADEFLAWNIITDPSWKHALQSWNRATDSGPPLFYIIGRLILPVTGPHPVAMRLYSATCFWLAAVLWTAILRRYFSLAIAIAAVAFTFLCNGEFVDQFAQVRFYGQMILAVSLAIYAALWLEDNEPSLGFCFLISLVTGVFLVTSHMIAIVYSAAIILAQFVVGALTRKRLASIAGTLLSWTTLLLCIPAIRSAKGALNGMMPGMMALVHCYANRPLLFQRARMVSVLLNVALYVAASISIWYFARRFRRIQPASLRLLFLIALLFLLAPVGFLIISHLYVPIWAGRYLLPYALGLGFFLAAAAWLLTKRFAAVTPLRLSALAAVPLAMIAFVTFREQATYPLSALEPALRLAQSMPVAMEEDNVAREAHYYAPARSQNIFYVMKTPKPNERSCNLASVAQGYDPSFVFYPSFVRQHDQFIYVASPRGMDFNTPELSSQWTRRDLGTISLPFGPLPVYLYTRKGSSAESHSQLPNSKQN